MRMMSTVEDGEYALARQISFRLTAQLQIPSSHEYYHYIVQGKSAVIQVQECCKYFWCAVGIMTDMCQLGTHDILNLLLDASTVSCIFEDHSAYAPSKQKHQPFRRYNSLQPFYPKLSSPYGGDCYY